MIRPESFRIVRSVWANVPLSDRTLDHLLQRLLSEENVAKSYKRKDEVIEEAYTVSGGTKGWYNPGSRGRGRGKSHGIRGGFIDKRLKGQHGANRDSRPRCEHCKIPGHSKDKCYKLHGYPDNDGNSSQAFISSSTFDSRSIMAFFADSGATKHMCDQRHFFDTFTAVEAGKWLVSGKIK